jgi:hypothetical protein
MTKMIELNLDEGQSTTAPSIFATHRLCNISHGARVHSQTASGDHIGVIIAGWTLAILPKERARV